MSWLSNARGRFRRLSRPGGSGSHPAPLIFVSACDSGPGEGVPEHGTGSAPDAASHASSFPDVVFQMSGHVGPNGENPSTASMCGCPAYRRKDRGRKRGVDLYPREPSFPSSTGPATTPFRPTAIRVHASLGRRAVRRHRGQLLRGADAHGARATCPPASRTSSSPARLLLDYLLSSRRRPRPASTRKFTFDFIPRTSPR